MLSLLSNRLYRNLSVVFILSIFLIPYIAYSVVGQGGSTVSPLYIIQKNRIDSLAVVAEHVDTVKFGRTTRDVNLYRASANRLKTDDSLTVNKNATFNETTTHTGIASFANGTAALPAIAGINDPNTGIRFGGNDTASVVTGGIDRLTVVGANVGIGTTGPVNKLDVNGGIRTMSSATPASGAGLELEYNTGVGYIRSIDRTGATWQPTKIYGSDVQLAVPGYDGIFLNSTGNVGIGTTGPGAKLDLFDGDFLITGTSVAHGMTTIAPTNAAGRVNIDDATQGGTAIWGLTDGGAASSLALALRGVTGHASPTREAIALVGGKKNGTGWQALAATELVLKIQNYSTDLVTVLGNGSFGIGTTTPSNAGKLSVAGGVTIGVATTDTMLNAHQLRINNGGTFSEIVAGETAFDNVSDENVKENITPVDTDSIYAIVKRMKYPRKWQYKSSILRTQPEIDRINETVSEKIISPIVQVRIDSLIKAKATGTFSVSTTQVPSVTYRKEIGKIEPAYARADLNFPTLAIIVPSDTSYIDVPETTYVARYDTVYTCSDSKRTQIWNSVLASQTIKRDVELASCEARIAKDASRPHVSVMAQDMYPVSRLMKGDVAKETTLSGDDLINALLISVKKQAEQIADLQNRVAKLEAK